jgi:catechol 2,3-dioxygenase-like lactoylglutathione lyase family enzyme
MRLQLALNVNDLEEAVAFYSKMFATEPARRRPGYANFALENPPLKLVLFEGNGAPGSINHLGVEVETTETWIQGPDSTRWEWYVRTGDSEQRENRVVGTGPGDACCT